MFKTKVSGTAPLKPPSRYTLVGTRVPRVELPAKMANKYEHMQHVRLPGMLHGRVVLPHGQRAYGAGAKPLAIDESSIKNIPGARVVRKGDFVGVVAEQEWDAVKAAAQLKVTWAETPALPAGDMYERMRAAKTQDTTVATRGDVTAGFAQAAHVASSSYRCPYQSHAPFAANCAVADVKPDSAQVMSSTQDVYSARKFLSDVLGMKPEQIRVQYHEGSGTFGRSCYGDAEQTAAILSQAVGRPVRVQFMRWDEHGWDQYGPAHLADVRAGIDADGNLVAYEYHGWQHGWTVTSTIYDISLQKPGVERASGSNSITVNPMSTGSMYNVPNRKVVSHAVPMAGYLRGAALRSPLDLSFCFASEQTIDELAHAIKMDPLEFRRKNIGDKRWLGVLNAAAEAAQWTPRVMASSLSDAEVVTGRGIGLGTHHVSYGAAVVDIEVNKRTGTIVAKKNLCRDGRWPRGEPGVGREPDHRPGGAIREPRAQGGSDVRQDRRHQSRLEFVSGPALRRTSRSDPGGRPAHGGAVDRGRRRGDGRHGGCRRQCFLRCDRETAAAISDESRAGTHSARQRSHLTASGDNASGGRLAVAFLERPRHSTLLRSRTGR